MKIQKKRSEPVKETQMVSLADIAFLIIFFFMLSSQFMKDKSQIKLPVIPRDSETKSQLTVSMNAEGEIRLNGDQVTDAHDLEARLHDMIGAKTRHEDLEVRFQADSSLRKRKYGPVIEAISSAGGIVAIIHDVKR